MMASASSAESLSDKKTSKVRWAKRNSFVVTAGPVSSATPTATGLQQCCKSNIHSAGCGKQHNTPQQWVPWSGGQLSGTGRVRNRQRNPFQRVGQRKGTRKSKELLSNPAASAPYLFTISRNTKPFGAKEIKPLRGNTAGLHSEGLQPHKL